MREKPFRYAGAKGNLLKVIYGCHPKNYRDLINVEVFGGSAPWLFFKPKSVLEIYNDYDEGVSSFFWCLINDFERFCFRLQYMHHSELILEWFTNFTPRNRLELAVKTLYEVYFRYGGLRRGVLVRWHNIESWKGRTHLPLFMFELFDDWRNRFSQVQIYSEDFEQLIERIDKKEVLYYCDPPYTEAEKKGFYGKNFSEEDHFRLAEVLSGVEGKFLLSYDDKPFVRELYSKFHIKEVKLNYGIQGGSKEKKYQELLIANYPIAKRMELTDFIRKEPIQQMS